MSVGLSDGEKFWGTHALISMTQSKARQVMIYLFMCSFLQELVFLAILKEF